MTARPRLGFLGLGWIGRNRLEALVEHGGAEVVAIADPAPARREAGAALVPAAQQCELLAELLEHDLDGVVIATPSAFHAEHAIACLSRGTAVFCQKPLGRSGAEARRVVDAARTADRLLGLDLSYRHTAAARALLGLVRGGELGRIYAIDLVFHNAYGPDAAWFYSKVTAGGGCVIDLGVHLVDLAMWLLGFPTVRSVDSLLSHAGEPLCADSGDVEDFASVQMQLAGGVTVRLTCSWRLPAGRDAVIEAALYGTAGGAALKNVGGSFHDFTAERYRGTQTEALCGPPDRWGGRALIAWTEQLARSRAFAPEAEELVEVARVLDAIYAAGPRDAMTLGALRPEEPVLTVVR